MINTETLKGCVRIHGVKSIRADAGPEDPNMQNQVAWLDITTSTGDRISIFMPYSTALAYASAINTVNDREAEEAYVPNENTVYIPADEWRKLNMGVPDAGKDTDTDH